ncbi:MULTISPECIES: hypothetical protein [unclassified Yoonia]|nr:MULTISPECIES: hypothetical protein [unclassified Yoonia]
MPRNQTADAAFDVEIATFTRGTTMRGILLWFIGLPIPVIILLYLFGVL